MNLLPAMDVQEILRLAIETAKKSPCEKSKRGVVIWENEEAYYEEPMVRPIELRTAFNGPPPGFACDGSSACREACGKICVHAESRALLEVWDTFFPTDILHVKVVGGAAVASGPPSCWQCSREILESGIKLVWLLHAPEQILGQRGDAPQVQECEYGLLVPYSAYAFHEATLRFNGLPVIRSCT